MPSEMSLEMSSKGKSESDERTSVAAFYAGRSIFVTGATGFMGKVLIEKLLRSCPEVREIFLLMRPKGGLSIDDRLRKMVGLPLFDKLRASNPSSFEKLIPVHGDTSVEGLGLPPIERRTIVDRVSIIFHVAANVRFHENLKKDISTNVRSTRDVCILAGGMKKLVALMHVSSTFAHSDKPVVQEIMYPPLTDWKSAILMVENLDEHIVQTFSCKIRGSMTNTYTFSKRLAEQVINDYSKDLPCVIFRPSIVVSTLEDPVSGWLDNFNGPVGVMVGGGKGVLRVVHLHPNVACDYVPVDIAIKVMLIAAWQRGLQTVTKDPSVHVYNGSSYQIRRVTCNETIAMGLKTNEDIPLEGILWYPRVYPTTNHLVHYILTLLLHLLPAVIIDGALNATGRKPMLLNIQKRVYCSMIQLSFFLHNEWAFINTKMLDLLERQISPAERQIFGYNFKDFNCDEYFRNCLVGAKRYLLKEDMTRVDAAKRHYNRMMVIDRIFNVSAIALLIWIFVKVGTLSYLSDMLCSL